MTQPDDDVRAVAVTAGENVRHAVACGLMPFGARNGTHTQPERVARGGRNSQTKLTPEQVLAIRASTKSLRALGLEYGVDYTLISYIRRRKIWTHI